MTTVYDAIKADHDVHRQLLHELTETHGDSARRRDLWNQFYYEVKSHAAAEEETFYSRLMRHPEGQDNARHSVAEHKELDDIMEDLNSMDFSSTGWLTRLKTLKHDYEHHMEEEENEIFDKGRELLSNEQVIGFAAEFIERKAAERKLVDQKADASLEE